MWQNLRGRNYFAKVSKCIVSTLVLSYLLIFTLYPLVSYHPFNTLSWFREFSYSVIRMYPGHALWAFFSSKNGKMDWLIYFDGAKFIKIPEEDFNISSPDLVFPSSMSIFRLTQALRFEPQLINKVRPWPCLLFDFKKDMELKFVPFYQTATPFNLELRKDKSYPGSLKGFKC